MSATSMTCFIERSSNNDDDVQNQILERERNVVVLTSKNYVFGEGLARRKRLHRGARVQQRVTLK